MRRFTLTVAAALTFAAIAVPGAASAYELENVQITSYQLGVLDNEPQAAGTNTNDLRGKILRISVSE